MASSFSHDLGECQLICNSDWHQWINEREESEIVNRSAIIDLTPHLRDCGRLMEPGDPENTLFSDSTSDPSR
jgi:hypothetical protein